MDTQVLIGLFTLGGAISGGLIGGFFSVRAAKIGYKKEIMEKEIIDLANQVKSYWHLEKEYLSQINKATNIPEDTIMKATRKVVKDKGYVYPNMSESKVDAILRKYE